MTKTKKARVVPIPGELHRVLSERKVRQVSETDLVFHQRGRPLSPDAVSKRFRKIWDDLGLNACRETPPHR